MLRAAGGSWEGEGRWLVRCGHLGAASPPPHTLPLLIPIHSLPPWLYYAHAVYDDEHMGDHMAVAVHFTNAPSTHAAGGELTAAVWLSTEGWAGGPAGDACLAVAGADPNISGA